jgi:major outer membrane protein P.IB
MWRYGGWGMVLMGFGMPAWAEVVLYGQLKGGVAYTKQHNQEGSMVQMEDYLSKLGLKHTEPIADGTDLIWQVETASP